MSYARSPRPVCSMTMGTSIICASLSFTFFTFTFHTPAPKNLAYGEGRSDPALRGLVIQKIEGLFVADSIPDSIERPIACQTRPDGFRSLFRLFGQGLDFPIDFLIADLDFFLLGDFIQQQRSLHLLQCLLPL